VKPRVCGGTTLLFVLACEHMRIVADKSRSVEERLHSAKVAKKYLYVAACNTEQGLYPTDMAIYRTVVHMGRVAKAYPFAALAILRRKVMGQ